jgi:hypothetical protein
MVIRRGRRYSAAGILRDGCVQWVGFQVLVHAEHLLALLIIRCCPMLSLALPVNIAYKMIGEFL